MCMPKTRTEIIEAAKKWACSSSDDEPHIFWLYAMAGEGKTSIATSVAHALHEKKVLGGSFFFSRDDANRARVDNVFATLVLQLIDHMPKFAEPAKDWVQGKKYELDSSALSQFQLLEELLQKSDIINGPIIFVLDALDECMFGQNQREILLKCLVKISHLSSSCRFFLTSRQEADIENKLSEAKSQLHPVDLRAFAKDAGETTTRDLKEYIKKELQTLPGTLENSDWPGQDYRQQLLDRTSGLFIWAFTAINFIKLGNYKEQLNLLLKKSTLQSSLYNLYRTVMDSAYPYKDSFTKEKHYILGAIILLQEPLSAASIGMLLHIHTEPEESISQTVNTAMGQLKSVLEIPQVDNLAIHILHPSFAEFLTAKEQLEEIYYINQESHHLNLAINCLQVMQELLHYNICKLRDSTKLNKEINELDQQVKEHIPVYLKYACQFWAE
ncbi:hypothetical protein BV25DRAFT_1638814, partial [Artomyces pyxidatus]